MQFTQANGLFTHLPFAYAVAAKAHQQFVPSRTNGLSGGASYQQALAPFDIAQQGTHQTIGRVFHALDHNQVRLIPARA